MGVWRLPRAEAAVGEQHSGRLWHEEVSFFRRLSFLVIACFCCFFVLTFFLFFLCFRSPSISRSALHIWIQQSLPCEIWGFHSSLPKDSIWDVTLWLVNSYHCTWRNIPEDLNLLYIYCFASVIHGSCWSTPATRSGGRRGFRSHPAFYPDWCSLSFPQFHHQFSGYFSWDQRFPTFYVCDP